MLFAQQARLHLRTEKEADRIPRRGKAEHLTPVAALRPVLLVKSSLLKTAGNWMLLAYFEHVQGCYLEGGPNVACGYDIKRMVPGYMSAFRV